MESTNSKLDHSTRGVEPGKLPENDVCRAAVVKNAVILGSPQLLNRGFLSAMKELSESVIDENSFRKGKRKTQASQPLSAVLRR